MNNKNQKEPVSRIERYFFNKERKIGGLIIVLLGGQGSGKTVALWNIGQIDYNQDRVVLWRGQKSCQWLGLAAQNIPTTVWLHDSIYNPEFFVSTTINEPKPSELNIEEKKDIDVKIDWFNGPQDLVDKIQKQRKTSEKTRANVYYIPGFEQGNRKKRFWAYQTHADLLLALTNRYWKSTHVSLLLDEVDEVYGDMRRQPFDKITEEQYPSAFKDFRKSNIKCVSSAHDTSDIHYKFWKNKANGRVYMREAIVNDIDSYVKQGIVANLNRGSFIVPAGGKIEKDHFNIPNLPHESISWLEEERKVGLKFDWEKPE